MSRARDLLVRRADRAGGTTLPWLIVTFLAGIELFGQLPVGGSWPSQTPGISEGVIAVSQFVWSHAGGTTLSDPFGAWTRDTLPIESWWLAIAAVPLFLTLMLAILREYRSPTLPGRALRLVAAGLAYLVVALYVRHLAVSRLDPLTIGLLSVHLALLAPLVAGIAILVRTIVGRPDPTHRINRPTAGARLRAGLVMLLATWAGVLLVGLLPLPA